MPSEIWLSAQEAITQHDNDKLEELLQDEKLKQDINFVSDNHGTLLHIAVRELNAKAIELLVANKAKLSVMQNGLAPIHMLATSGSEMTHSNGETSNSNSDSSPSNDEDIVPMFGVVSSFSPQYGLSSSQELPPNQQGLWELIEMQKYATEPAVTNSVDDIKLNNTIAVLARADRKYIDIYTEDAIELKSVPNITARLTVIHLLAQSKQKEANTILAGLLELGLDANAVALTADGQAAALADGTLCTPLAITLKRNEKSLQFYKAFKSNSLEEYYKQYLAYAQKNATIKPTHKSHSNLDYLISALYWYNTAKKNAEFNAALRQYKQAMQRLIKFIAQFGESVPNCFVELRLTMIVDIIFCNSNYAAKINDNEKYYQAITIAFATLKANRDFLSKLTANTQSKLYQAAQTAYAALGNVEEAEKLAIIVKKFSKAKDAQKEYKAAQQQADKLKLKADEMKGKASDLCKDYSEGRFFKKRKIDLTDGASTSNSVNASSSLDCFVTPVSSLEIDGLKNTM